MIKLLKMSLLICCLTLGTYAIAKPEVMKSINVLNSIAQVKDIKANTVVKLKGKLILNKETFILEDSTGKIALDFQYDSDEPNDEIGQNVIITGKVKEGIAEPFINVTYVEVVEHTDTSSADTRLQNKPM